MRKIIHVDMDCFYAAVEMRENPALVGKPIAVGGGEPRSVVATCNYEARELGVRSAMAGFEAKKKCPRLIFLPLRRELYEQVSRQIRAIFDEYTPDVEPLLLDGHDRCSRICVHRPAPAPVAARLRKQASVCR